MAGDQLGRHELGFGAGILASPLAIDGSQEGGGPRTGHMQWVNHVCTHASRPPLKGPNCRAVDAESGPCSLCLWILVADREIEPDEHVLSDLLLEDSGNRGTVSSRLQHDSLWLQHTTCLLVRGGT